MSNKGTFYITTTLPYVNADPHIGFAMEIIRADVIARYKKLMGYEVFFNTGTDEHGLKIFRNASDNGVLPQAYVNSYAEKYKGLIALLNLSPDIHFIRTTDKEHIKAAQDFWKLCDAAGDIYKKKYKIKYCVGCELEKTDSELVNGRCAIHPQLELEIIEEENYFFRFSKYQEKLLELYKRDDFVIPTTRLHEIKAFVERGLEDFSISRLASKMSWGVPVPGDNEQVMYVWFDALVNYISTLGWPKDTKNFEKFWTKGTPVQYCGKDNLRQQAAMWQAMLMSAGLPQTHTIVIDGFITGAGGVKMSKSLGNTVNPYDLVSEYGVDAVRYFVLRELSPFEDSPFSPEQFKEAYNGNLANGLGNLVSRIMKMATTYGIELSAEDKKMVYYSKSIEELEQFNIREFIDQIWSSIKGNDEFIQKREPFKKIKTEPKEAKQDIYALLFHLLEIALKLEPLLPETSKKIKDCVLHNKMPEKPLFLRKD